MYCSVVMPRILKISRMYSNILDGTQELSVLGETMAFKPWMNSWTQENCLAILCAADSWNLLASKKRAPSNHAFQGVVAHRFSDIKTHLTNRFNSSPLNLLIFSSPILICPTSNLTRSKFFPNISLNSFRQNFIPSSILMPSL